jgi:excisionase family DNA binding protein
MLMTEMMEQAHLVYSPAEVARLLRVNEETVRREIRRGHLGALRVGNQYRSTISDLAKWLGEERFIELFSPLGVLSELIGKGGLSETQAIQVASKTVKQVRKKTPLPRKYDGSAPTPVQVRKRLRSS